MPITNASIRAEVKGLKETQANMEGAIRDLHGAPMLNAMRDATLLVQRDAKKLSPVDTGRLRASILPDIRQMGGDTVGVVGSNVIYAPFVELGTRPHWPPPGVLAVWAKRHHVNEYVIRRAIGLHGTKGRQFLTRSFQQNRQRIYTIIERGVKGITDEHNHN